MRIRPETIRAGLTDGRRNGPLAIAHRGASSYAPENTLEAFRKAAALGADMWELDVRLSADGVCMVAHSDDLAATTGESGRVSKTPYGRLRRIPGLKGGFIPRFDQVLELAQDLGAGLYVELKDADAGPEVVRLLTEKKFEPAVIGSFLAGVIRSLKASGCSWPLSILVPAQADPFALAEQTGADMIHLCWEGSAPNPQKLITSELLERARFQGLEVVLWHEERREIVADLIGLPVWGICSSAPEMLKPFVASTQRPIQVVCHRGAGFFAPENTLSAARICYNQGFQFVEIDVRTTADGMPIVMHDATVDRTTNGHGLVRDMTWAEIERLDAGAWFDPFYTGEPVARLEDLLRLAHGNGGLYIEIKDGREAAVLDAVVGAGMEQRCFYWSEHAVCLERLRRAAPSASLMLRRKDVANLPQAIDRLCPYIVEFEWPHADPDDLEICRKAGVKRMALYLGTDADVFRVLIRLNFELINLDRSDIFKRVYRSNIAEVIRRDETPQITGGRSRLHE